MNKEVETKWTLPDQKAHDRLILSTKFFDWWIFPHSLISIAGMIVIMIPALYNLWLGLIGISFLAFICHINKALKPLNFQPLGLGIPNLITIARFIVLMWFALFHRGYSDLTLFIAFTVVILLDGLDGFVARRFGQCSSQGEQLDAETDAQLVWLLSWIHYTSGNVDWWILVPGSLRYTYQLLFFWVPVAPNFPSKKFRATVAVIFFLSLSLTFVLPVEIATYLLAFASSLIIVSFGLSLYGSLTSRKLFLNQ